MKPLRITLTLLAIAVAGFTNPSAQAAAESLELTHRATDRAVFAEGTLTALRWLSGKPAGFYSLRDWVADHLRRTGN